MKITLIREERESGKEAVSTQETDMLMEKLKTENKTGYITELRSIIPHLKGPTPDMSISTDCRVSIPP